TPDAAKIHIVGAVIVGKHGRIDGIATLDRLWLWLEGARRRITNGYTDLENTVAAFGREIKIVFTVFGGRVGSPHLPLGPGYIPHMQRHAVIHSFAAGAIERQHVVVLHAKMIAVVI